MSELIVSETRARPTWLPKEALFGLVAQVKCRTLVEFAHAFDLPTITTRVYGFHPGAPGVFGETLSHEIAAERWAEVLAHTRASSEWHCFEAVHDFAVDGIYHEDVDVYAMLMNASKMTSFFMAANPFEAAPLDQLVQQAWARHEMEVGGFVRFDPFVRLAGVDARTVRNAISAGDLVFHKNDGNGVIEGKSAKRWLTGRRGFKPTRMIQRHPMLETIDTPSALVEFLGSINAQRVHDGLLEPPLNLKGIQDLERGAFNFSLDAVYPLADYYGVERDVFLKCVMRVFFAAQYRALLAAGDHDKLRRDGPLAETAETFVDVRR